MYATLLDQVAACRVLKERLEAEQPRTEKTAMALSLLRDGQDDLLQRLALLDQSAGQDA